MKKNNIYFIIFILIVLIYKIYKLLHSGTVLYNSDTVSYFYPSNIFTGDINPFRMVVFPAILAFLNPGNIAGLGENVLLFNYCCSFFSVLLFYLLLRKIVHQHWLVLLFSLFFMQWEVINRFNAMILPETFCVFLSVLLGFVFVVMIKDNSHIARLVLPILIGFAVFTKPTFMLLFVVYLFFVVYSMDKSNYKKQLLGIVMLMLVTGSLWLFKVANHSKFGYNGITMVSLNNDLANICLSASYKNDEDKELVSMIDSTFGRGYYISVFYLNNFCIDYYKKNANRFPGVVRPSDDMDFIMGIDDVDNISYARLNSFVNRCKAKSEFWIFIFKKIYNIHREYKKITLAIIILLIVLFYDRLKTRKKIKLYIVMFVVVSFITVGYGGIYDWERLLVYSFPYFLIIYAILISFLSRVIPVNRLIVSLKKQY